ncbi:MAG: ABC transporter ATP-binding protein [Kiritimatiellia bacterium]
MIRLIEELPPVLKKNLGIEHGTRDDLIIAVRTDLTRQGAFGNDWLVVTQVRLQVYHGAALADPPWFDQPVTNLRDPLVESLVGGCVLQVTVDGVPIELVRYTNARSRVFARVVKYLADAVSYHKSIQPRKTETPDPNAEPVDPPRLTKNIDEAKRCPVCHLHLADGTQVCPACLSKTRVVWRILKYMRPYWSSVVAIWALLIATTLLNLVPPYLTLPLVDKVLMPGGKGGADAQRITLLGWLVAGLLASQLVSLAISVIRGRIMARLGSRVAHDLRTEVFQHIQLHSLRFFDKRKTGELMSRVAYDTESLEGVLIDGVQFFVVNVLTLIGIGGVLLYMNWQLTLLVFIPVPVVMVLSKMLWTRLFHKFHRHWFMRGRLGSTLNDSLSGIRVIKAFARERQETARFNSRSLELQEASLASTQAWTTHFPILGFLTSSGALIVWYVGGRFAVGGHITTGMLMAFVAYLGMFYGPLQFLTRIADWMARSLASAHRVFEILDTVPDVPEAADPVSMPRIEGRVQFKDLTFGYDRYAPVLRKINLDIQPGEMLGLVGHSGAGKSTAINLLCRFYDPDEGALLIDGVDVRRISQYDLRSQLGVVLQDTFLFNGTIAENIGYAKDDATPEEIMAAAKAANAHEFILKKPDGYDTLVGERGQSLSGGERQRIAIARAILHSPRILILDEATSSVDTDTEKQIQDAIRRLVKGRTTFAIAHRLSTLRNASRLIVLKNGKIIEMGTHDELMARQGEFHRLVKMQRDMAEIAALKR